jgi:UDP-N-acetylenolpyruvoylglucosamine reductase
VTTAIDAHPGTRAPIEWYYVDSDPLPRPNLPIAWRAVDLQPGPNGTCFDVRHQGACLGTFRLGLPGRHNVGNALAVIALAETLGIERDTTRRALARYRGAARRYQVLGSADGVTVVDDYAHHPTEIAATLAAARGRYAGRRLWAIVQPHTFSRVAALGADFAASLAPADAVVLTPIYAAREAPLAGVDSERIASGILGGKASVMPSLDAAVEHVARSAAAGDVLLFMGAGDITQASHHALERLRARAMARLTQAARGAKLGGALLPGESIGAHTSLRVGGPADLMVRVGQPEDLAGWFTLAARLGVPVRVLGRGSNVLVHDNGFSGLVLLNRCEGWRLTTDLAALPAPDMREGVESAQAAYILADSGVSLAALGQALARQGWGGLEAGVGIPGSLGAGVVTNAGAHQWEMADSVVAAEVVDADGGRRWWSNPELAFRYRGSALKGETSRLVLRVLLRVMPAAPDALLARIEQFTAHRRRTQPATPSVGSMFKNPPGDFAGRLIEAAGLKGKTVGGAQISPTHANFFVNRCGAAASAVEALIELARRTVRARFGVELELEIEPLGELEEAR